MNLHGIICFESFATHCAVEWSVHGVDFEMFPDMRDSFEQFPALTTLKVPGLIVNTEMFCKSILGDEAFVTVHTLVRSVTCVGFHVQSEVVLTFDSFGTHRTLVDISGPVY